MRYPAAEKLEIIRLVEQSALPVRRTLDKIGIPRATFYLYGRLSRCKAILNVRIRRRPQGFGFGRVCDQRDSFRVLINSTRVSTPKSVKARTPSFSRP